MFLIADDRGTRSSSNAFVSRAPVTRVMSHAVVMPGVVPSYRKGGMEVDRVSYLQIWGQAENANLHQSLRSLHFEVGGLSLDSGRLLKLRHTGGYILPGFS